MRMPRMTTRSLMVEVAIMGSILGLLVLAYGEGHRQINLVESDYYHFRVSEETDPVREAEWVERAGYHDRMVRYYGRGR